MQFIRLPLIHRIGLAALAVAGLAVAIASCSKSKPTEEPSPAVPLVSNKIPAVPAPGNTNQGMAAANTESPLGRTNSTGVPATPEQIQLLAGLEKSYVVAGSFDDRFDAALAIGKAGTAEGVKALERLFRAEKDSELRTELINALIGISDCKDERLALLRLGVTADQAPLTREAAIDGLVDLDDERALPILKELTNDADEQVRAVAKHALGLLTELLKAP